MKGREPRLHDGMAGAALAIRVIPQAHANEIASIQGDGTLQVRLTMPLEEQKLNEALIELLADVLGVPAERIQIVAGLAGADKLVTVDGMDAESLTSKVIARLS
jgi:uncharacterized protein YggU (UPF0235/DUF167 family)